MSIVAFCSDVHIGNHRRLGGPMVSGINTRCRMTLFALSQAIEKARAAGAEFFVVAGDLFDSCAVTPQVMTAVGAILRGAGMQVILLVGNHDQHSDAPGDHALGPLGLLPNVQVVERPSRVHVGGADILYAIPFSSEVGDTYIPGALEALGERCDGLIAIHAGIRDKDTPVFLSGARDSIGLEVIEAKDRRVFAGNWHNGKAWGGVVQCGTLAPTGFDNAWPDFGGVEATVGGLYLHDTRTRKGSYQHVDGPRFVKWNHAVRHASGNQSIMDAKARGTLEALALLRMQPAMTFVEWTEPASIIPGGAYARAEELRAQVGLAAIVLRPTPVALPEPRAPMLGPSSASMAQAIDQWAERSVDTSVRLDVVSGMGRALGAKK